MENIYEKFSLNAIGENEVLNVGNILYEFKKISEFKYLVQHSIYILDKWVELNGTMTTMEASLMYEAILKNQTK